MWETVLLPHSAESSADHSRAPQQPVPVRSPRESAPAEGDSPDDFLLLSAASSFFFMFLFPPKCLWVYCYCHFRGSADQVTRRTCRVAKKVEISSLFIGVFLSNNTRSNPMYKTIFRHFCNSPLYYSFFTSFFFLLYKKFVLRGHFPRKGKSRHPTIRGMP